MNWYLKVFNQYFDFSGRARRKEFWMFALINFIVLILLSFLDELLGTKTSNDEGGIGLLYLVYYLVSILPSLAVSIRRLHDIGKSGWYIFITLIPLAGAIWFLILVCMEGEPRPNQWGENPKGIGNDRIIDQIGKE